MATDDKAAIKFFTQESPNLPILSTPDIIKYWSDQSNLSSEQVYPVLNLISTRARYQPPKNHPLKSWWQDILKIQ